MIAPVLAASADISAKIVVPNSASRLSRVIAVILGRSSGLAQVRFGLRAVRESPGQRRQGAAGTGETTMGFVVTVVMVVVVVGLIVAGTGSSGGGRKRRRGGWSDGGSGCGGAGSCGSSCGGGGCGGGGGGD
ncbi:hypothetical protein GCM10017562_35930 [Streptomyces roseofulvus]